MRAPKAGTEPTPLALKRRRALSHVGGAAEVSSDSAELGSLIAKALDVGEEDERVLAHVHGFHSYPARMHAETARSLIEALSKRNDVVLDPFVGAGTTALAASRLGRAYVGIDMCEEFVMLAQRRLADELAPVASS